MGRTARSRDLPHPPPVEKIELSEKNQRGRLLAAVLFLAIGAVALAYGFLSLVSGEAGWREIEAADQADSCAGDFTFSYLVSGAAENRAVTALYTQAAQTAGRLFSADQAYEGVNNLFALNSHPNETLELDPALYRVFSLLEASGRRDLYLGPVYAAYRYLFQAQDDAYARELDPWLDQETGAYYRQLAAYARDPAAVKLELLGDNRARLTVSQDYLRFAAENEIDHFIDFGWMKNAFLADYLAEALLAEGYTQGALSSYDGFSRSLTPGDISYSLVLYDRAGEGAVPAAVMDYTAPTAFVCLRDFPLDRGDSLRFYRYASGETRTPYVSLADSLCHSALSSLTAYSQSAGCGELLLDLLPVYVADSFDEAPLLALSREGIQSVWCDGGVLYYTDPALELRDLYESEGLHYTAELAS